MLLLRKHKRKRRLFWLILKGWRVVRLWELTDEPLTNEVFAQLADLETALAERCVSLTDQQERIRKLTLYHWWPGGADHTTTV